MRKTLLALGVTGALALLLLNPYTVAWAQGLIQTRQIADSAITTAKINNGAVTAAKLSPAVGTDGQVLKLSGGALSWGTDNTGGGGSSGYTGPDYPVGSFISNNATFVPATDFNTRVTVCGSSNLTILPATSATATVGDTMLIYRPACINASSWAFNDGGVTTYATISSNNTATYVRWNGSTWAVLASDGSTFVNQSELSGLPSTTTRVFCRDCASSEGLGVVLIRGLGGSNTWVTERERLPVTTSMSTYFLAYARARAAQNSLNPLWAGCHQPLWQVTTVYNCFGQVASGTGAGNTSPTSFNTSVGLSGLSTGTTATGRVGWYSASAGTSGPLLVGRLGYMRLENVMIPTLSDGTNTFQLRMGFSAAAPGGSMTGVNSVVAVYNSTAATAWRLETYQTSSNGATAGSTAILANTYYTLEILYDSTGATPSATMWVNGTQLGSVTSATAVPTASASARWMPFVEIRKSVGTSARTVQMGLVTYLSWLGHIP